MDGFNKIKSLLVIRDSEKSVDNAVKQVVGALSKNFDDIPRSPHKWTEGKLRIGFLLFPNCTAEPSAGTLEDLCLSILSEDNAESVLSEINDFMIMLKEKYGRCFPHDFKTKLHTYFSVTDDYVSLKIGEAARAGAFNWNHAKLVSLKNFINEVL
jgi:hypothetical protein